MNSDPLRNFSPSIRILACGLGLFTAAAGPLVAQTEPAPAALPVSSPALEEANTLADLKVLAERNPAMLPRRGNLFLKAANNGQLEVVTFFTDHKISGLDFSAGLKAAAKAGHLAVVKLLTERNPAPLDFAAALLNAASVGHLPVVDYLLAHGADPKKDGGAALVPAMLNDKSAVIYKLIDAGADLNAGIPNPDGTPARPPVSGTPPQSPPPPPGILRPLARALDSKDEQLARYLVEKGARCDVPSETEISGGKSPLHLAWTVELTRFFLEHGADREARDYNGLTPLLAAAGNFEVMETLIAAGADLTAKDPGDGTVIYHLTRSISGHPALIKAETNFRPNRSPINSNRLQPTENREIAEINDPAVKTGREAAVRILDAAIKAGVSVNAQVKQFGQAWGANPAPVFSNLPVLAKACEWMETRAQADFMEQLIQRGAEVNFSDENGVTPLHTAAYRRNGPLIEVLLKHGANPLAETTFPLEVQNGVVSLTAKSPARGRSVGPPDGTRRNDERNAFFRYRPINLTGVKDDGAADKEIILLLARATYARDFPDRNSGIWQDYTVLQTPYDHDGAQSVSPQLYKIADPALDGKKPVPLLEAVMRAEPGLEDTASPEVHILRRRPDNDREAEDIVFDLNLLTAANPPAVPELKQGDVLLLLQRELEIQPPNTYEQRRKVVPMPRNLAIYLEEKQAINVTVTAPEEITAMNGEWKIYRPLVAGEFRTDLARHTAWSGLSLSMAGYGIFKFETTNGNRNLKPRRIARAGGEPVVDLPPDSRAFWYDKNNQVFLRDGDRIEITGSEPNAQQQQTGPSRRRTVVLPSLSNP